MKKVLRPQFKLAKVKMMKDDAGVDVKYTLATKEGAAMHEDEYTIRCSVVPHPHLIEAIRALDIFIARSNGYVDLETVAPKMELDGDQRKTVERILKNTLDKITPTGLALSGADKTRGIVITAKYACSNKSDIAINSPRIIFERDIFKFEAELAEKVDRVIEEIFCYLFEDKKSQVEIPFPNEEGKKKSKKQLDIVNETQE